MTSILFYYSFILGFFIIDLFSRFLKDPKKAKAFCCILSCLLLAALYSIRGNSVGSDTNSYFQNFEQLSNTPLSSLFKEQLEYPERGFAFFTAIIGKTSGTNFLFYKIICSLFIFLPLSLLVYRKSPIPVLSFVIYYCLGLFAFNMSALRQSLAISFCILGTLFFNKHKFWTYLVFYLFLFVAFEFHRSSLVFSIYPFLSWFKIDSKNKVALLLMISIIYCLFFRSVFSWFYFKFTDITLVYSFQAPSGERFFSFSLFAMSVLTFSIIILTSTQNFPYLEIEKTASKKIPSFFGKLSLSDYSDKNNQDFFLSSNCAILYLSLTLLDLVSVAASRLGVYFLWSFMIFIPSFWSSIHPKSLRGLLLIPFLLFCFLYLYFSVFRDNYLSLIPFEI